jgi:putative addiction module component (TIGR02574 family)
MTERVKEVSEQALKLTPEERARLADFLLESIEPRRSEVTQAWSEEVRARIAAFERGDYELEDADQVLAEAKAALRG